VKNVDDKPPWKHRLVLLAKKAGLPLHETQEQFLETVTDFNIEARYPDVKFSFYKMCTREFTEMHLQRIEEFYQWLLQLIKSETSSKDTSKN